MCEIFEYYGRRALIFGLFLCAAFSPLWAETFRFQYREGERYRILSEIEQDVHVNREFHHSAELLNRIQVEVLETRGASGRENVYYQHSVEAQSSTGEAYRFGREYSSNFWRDEFGFYDIDDGYFVPTVRNVPVFPDRNLNPGDTWAAPGQEVHDFREDFNVQEAFSFTMPVSYKYVGPVRRDGIDLHHIKIEYTVFHQRAIPERPRPYPYLITGFSDQNVYFDNILGRAHSYEEEYEFILQLSNGVSLSFSGRARAQVIESEELDRRSTERDIQKRLNDLGVEDSSVLSDARGITIALENIQFLPDSAELLPTEKAKIDKIARILADYPQRDILVSGHAALAGSSEGQLILSGERAKVVVEYLLAIGARDRSRIMYQGFGAERPLADNSSEEGMRRNRRVEITILEN